jgi:hypothetical protein
MMPLPQVIGSKKMTSTALFADRQGMDFKGVYPKK